MLISDVPTGETLAFVQAHVPRPPARILEVGCGDGVLAARLQEVGYQIIALDSSAKAVAQARERGVDAREARWPEFNDDPFDAVLFTRSLHHISPLPEAVVRAKQLLKPQGCAVIEDFACDEIESLAAEWLYEILSLLDAANLLRRGPDGFADRFLRQKDALAAWRAGHHHDLHTAKAILACLQQHFVNVQTSTVPYLYRYVCWLLKENEEGHRIAQTTLEIEKRFTGAAGLSWIGRRFVASNVSRQHP